MAFLFNNHSKSKQLNTLQESNRGPFVKSVTLLLSCVCVAMPPGDVTSGLCVHADMLNACVATTGRNILP